MKRIISALTSAAVIISTTVSFAGCDLKTFFTGEGSSSTTTAYADEAITNGEWLSMVNDAFGMKAEDENSETADIDTAKAWNVIGEDEQIDENALATDKFMTSTLVRASGLVGPDATDEEIAMAAVDNGIISPDKNITDMQNAVESLSIAQTQWSNQTFDPVEEISYVEGVQDFSGEDALKNVKINSTDNTVIMAADYAKNLSADTVYVLPPNDENKSGIAYKVVSSTDNGDGTYTLKNTVAELNEVYDSLHVAGNYNAAYDQAQAIGDAEIMDDSSDENQINGVSRNFADDQPVISNLAYSQSEANIQQLFSKSSTKKRSDSIKVRIPFDGFAVEASISNIVMRSNVDIDFGFLDVDINQIYYAVDYDTSIAFSYGKKLQKVNDKDELAELLGVEGKKDFSKDICTIPIYVCAGFSVDFKVNISVSASGSIELKLTHHNTKGFEITGSGCRSIREDSFEHELKVVGTAGFYFGAGIALSVLGHSLVSCRVKAGPEISASATLHLDDKGNTMLCLDLSLYLQVTGYVELNAVLYTATYTLFKLDAKSSPLKKQIHYEDFKEVPKCTWKDRNAVTTAPVTEVIPEGIFSLQKNYLTLTQGASAKLSLASAPSGINTSNLKWKSSKPSVVSVDSSGNITAVAPGSATITVSTADGKYSASCAVSISESFANAVGVKVQSQGYDPGEYAA